jgi:hypothetical protein
MKQLLNDMRWPAALSAAPVDRMRRIAEHRR